MKQNREWQAKFRLVGPGKRMELGATVYGWSWKLEMRSWGSREAEPCWGSWGKHVLGPVGMALLILILIGLSSTYPGYPGENGHPCWHSSPLSWTWFPPRKQRFLWMRPSRWRYLPQWPEFDLRKRWKSGRKLTPQRRHLTSIHVHITHVHTHTHSNDN